MGSVRVVADAQRWAAYNRLFRSLLGASLALGRTLVPDPKEALQVRRGFSSAFCTRASFESVHGHMPQARHIVTSPRKPGNPTCTVLTRGGRFEPASSSRCGRQASSKELAATPLPPHVRRSGHGQLWLAVALAPCSMAAGQDGQQ